MASKSGNSSTTNTPAPRDTQTPPPSLIWTPMLETMLPREVLVVQPHQFKVKTRDRGERWQKIANNLNPSKKFMNKLTIRSVREKTSTLLQRFKTKQRMELNATGISPEVSELDILLEEILSQIAEFENTLAENNNKANKKTEKEKAQGEDIRKKAMETFAETSKCKSDSDDVKPKKRRSSGSETGAYLKERFEIDSQQRAQELQLQRQKLELEAEKMKRDQENQKNIMTLMNNQMQQTQQLTLAMLEKFCKENK